MTPLNVVLVCADGGGPADAERKRADAAEAAARLGVAAVKVGSRLVVMLAEFKEFVSAFVSDITILLYSLPLFRARDISLVPALRARGRRTQRTAAYRWLWIQSATGCIGGIIQGCFSYYWFQDCYPHGYYFLGWKVSHSVQTAVSVNIIVGTFTNICISWSGNYWREREGGRQICLGPSLTLRQGTPTKRTIIPNGVTGIIGWLTPFSYVFFSSWSPEAFPHGILYTIVIFWTVYQPSPGDQ
jgi:hypothetical protein